MKRALVTGAAGFVGAVLARRLVALGHETHLVARPGGDPWRLRGLDGAAALHACDLEDAAGLARLCRDTRPEWIFHLAAHGAYSTQTDLGRMMGSNVNATVNVIQAALGCGCAAVVNTGSSSEYGLKDHAPPETEALEPNSHYAVTKAAATSLASWLARLHRFPIPTLRLYSVYGPFEEPTRLLPKLVAHALRGALPPLVNPAIARDFVHVDDVVDAYLLAAGSGLADPGAVFNIGSGVQTSLSELVARARLVLGVREEPRWGTMPDRAWDTHVWVADPTRAERELGWRARTSLDQGLLALRDWLSSAPERGRYEPGATWNSAP